MSDETEKNLGRCAALNGEGRRCRRQGTRREQYHGHPEFYGYLSQRAGVSWVQVVFCDLHGVPEPRKPKVKP